MSAPVVVRPAPLEREAFAEFGDVIETAGAQQIAINEGTTIRFHDLARVEVASEHGGRALINIFRGTPRPLPLDVALMERHPLGSQAFVPLSARPFLVLVAPRGPAPEPAAMRAFVTAPGQGVNYAPGVWHHPLLALGAASDFLVVDRGGPGANLDEVAIAPGTVSVLGPGPAPASCSAGAGSLE